MHYSYINSAVFFLLLLGACTAHSHEKYHGSTRFFAQHYDNPYSETIAHVRASNALCAQEITYLKARQPIVKKTLESLLQIPLQNHELPRIALCFSGGGYRAMIATLGTCAAADAIVSKHSATRYGKGLMSYMHDITHSIATALHLIPSDVASEDVILDPMSCGHSLLDACTYNASLSGSSWAIAGWIDSRMDPESYLSYLTTQLGKHILTDINMTDLIATLIERYHYSQPISLINYFGVLLAQKILLAKKASGNSLVSKCSYIEQGMIPFPIYSAIIGNAGNCEYSWIEFTPYEIGSTKLGSFIPTWAFDRPFNNGVSQNFAAPQTLSYGMGIWGSAISITAAEFFKNITLPRLIEEGEHTKRIAEDEVCCSQTRTSYDYRFSPARVANWNFGSTQLPLSDQKTITLVDAGIQCSLPLAPLLRPERAIDIILVFDASSDELGSELQIAQTWAHEQGLKFPPINYDLIHNTCSVHQHPTDPSVPTIIYMPLMKNRHYKNGWDPRTADFTSTFNFVYSCAQVAQLSGLSACNILTNQAMILDTIHEWIIRKKQRTL